MSRKSAPVSFASKGMFDVLSRDADDDDDVEEEEVAESQSGQTTATATNTSTSATSSLSKSARKRLAKERARAESSSANTTTSASGTMENIVAAVPNKEQVVNAAETGVAKISETLANTKTAVSQAVNGNVDGHVNGYVNGVKAEPSSSRSGASSGPLGLLVPSSQSANETVVFTENQASSTAPKPIGSSFTPSPNLPVPPRPLERKPSVTSPPSTKFSPALPETLPQPPSNALPSNRKRKTPNDFTPSGPGVNTPSSPNKSSVKFEDGVSPGEGQAGERTMTPKKTQQPLVAAKNRNAIERTVWTFIMIGGFIALLCAGHPYMIILVLLCQTLVYNEVTALFDLRDAGSKKIDEDDKWSKTLNWYFFVVVNYLLYGESIIYYFKHIVFVDAYFIPFARNHRFISFMLYVVGFVGFVANLQRQYLRQQFALFCWVHISLLLVVVSSHFIVNNILEGLVWFFIPASLVICNDVMAYVCGKMFGRTPLIKLSPKKTVEGFVGAFICTLIFGIAWGTFFMRFPYMICPARDLGTSVFSQISCKPNPVFVWRDFEFTGPARKILEMALGHAPPTIPYAPFQIHCLVMATFASLVAPFGGFFASGFKRAFNIKDFGHSIPGHGGMTDRMDCQFMMGMFAYVYYSSLIRIQNVTVGSIMQTVVTSLTQPEQLELLADLRRFLGGQGVKL